MQVGPCEAIIQRVSYTGDLGYEIYVPANQQVALYQAYMEPQVPGISQNLAIFTAINKDTAELYFEQVPFNGRLAQQASDRGVRIIQACDAHDLLPRLANDPTHYECKFCPWQDRCWGGPSL